MYPLKLGVAWMSNCGLIGHDREREHTTNLGLCRGRERKESPGTVDGGVYEGVGYAVVLDCGAGGWVIWASGGGLTVEEADVDAGRAYLCGGCVVEVAGREGSMRCGREQGGCLHERDGVHG